MNCGTGVSGSLLVLVQFTPEILSLLVKELFLFPPALVKDVLVFPSERESMTNNIIEAILKNKHCSANRLSLRLLIGDDTSIPYDVKMVV